MSMTRNEAHSRGRFDGWIAAQPSYTGPFRYFSDYVQGYKQGELDCLADMYEHIEQHKLEN